MSISHTANSQSSYQPVIYNVAPYSKYTHWKQTVFYIDKALPVMSGEEITGTFAVRNSPEHQRNLDIKISYHFDGLKYSYHSERFYKLK